MQYREAAWLWFIYQLSKRQPPLLICFPTTPPPIQFFQEITTHKKISTAVPPPFHMFLLE